MPEATSHDFNFSSWPFVLSESVFALLSHANTIMLRVRKSKLAIIRKPSAAFSVCLMSGGANWPKSLFD